MFLRPQSQLNKAERIAGQAWDQLASVIDSAGSSARTYPHATRKRVTDVYVDASGRVELGAKEARRRATNAFDALIGRQPAKPWGLLAAATLGGAAVGWLTAAAAQRLATRRGPLEVREAAEEDAWLSPTARR